MKLNLRRVATAVVIPVVALAMHVPPAAAASAAGGGTATGTVTVSPGIDLTTRATTFVFSNSSINGVVAADNGATFAGSVNLPNVTGGSSAENTVQGAGTVNGFTATGTSPAGCTIRAVVGPGTFTRVGGTVIVQFNNATFDITCPPPRPSVAGATGKIKVVAEFVPTSGDGSSPTNPVGTPVTQATFVGAFEVGV